MRRGASTTGTPGTPTATGEGHRQRSGMETAAIAMGPIVWAGQEWTKRQVSSSKNRESSKDKGQG